jgi:hypothetical protein
MTWRDVDALGGNGVLTKKDVKELNQGVVIVLEIMQDGEWHTVQELRDKTGQACADRRMRQLRDFGFSIQAQRDSKNRRLWYYRLVTLDDAFGDPTPELPVQPDVGYRPESHNRIHANNRMLLCTMNRIANILSYPNPGNQDAAKEALRVAQRALASVGCGSSPDEESRGNLFNRKD